MSYLVLARKYRPGTFSAVVGQEPITRTLCNAMAKERLAHAYLFAGPRGVGKTSVARILAKALNCPDRKGSDPCNGCETCQGISVGEDIDVLEIDGASNNGVEEVRALRDGVRYAPSRSRYKIYIIDEVHMLSIAAFNALLKTLEEPPPHVLFFFATTDPEKLPPTIHSRCQRFNFRRIPLDGIVQSLRETCRREEVEVEDGALWELARRAGGSLRDALSLLDQALSYGGGQVDAATVREMLGLLPSAEVLSILGEIREGKAPEALRSLHRLLSDGADLSDFLTDMVGALRDMLILKMSPESADLVERPPEETARLAEDAESVSQDTLLHSLAVLQEVRSKIRWDALPRIRVEVALAELARLPDLLSIDEIRRSLGTASGSPEGAWQAAVRKLEEENPTLGGVLEGMRPLSVEGGTLKVGYPSGSPLIEGALRDRARRQAIEEAVRGSDPGIERVEMVSMDRKSPRKGPVSYEDHPAVEAARRIFREAEGEKESRS